MKGDSAKRRVVASSTPNAGKVVPSELPWFIQPGNGAKQPEQPVRVARPQVVDSSALFVESGLVPPGGDPLKFILCFVLSLSGGTMLVLLMILYAASGGIESGDLVLTGFVGAFVAVFGCVLAVLCIAWARKWHPWPLAVHRVNGSVVVQCVGKPDWAPLTAFRPALVKQKVRLVPQARWWIQKQDGESVWGIWMVLYGTRRRRCVLLEVDSEEPAETGAMAAWVDLLGVRPAAQDVDIKAPDVVYYRRSDTKQRFVETDFSRILW